MSSGSLTSESRQLLSLSLPSQPPQLPSLVPGRGLVEGAAWNPQQASALASVSLASSRSLRPW